MQARQKQPLSSPPGQPSPSDERFADELCRKCANELYYCEWMEYSSKKKKKPRKRLIVVASFLMFVIQREGKSKLKVLQTIHFLDLRQITCNKPNVVELAFERQGKQTDFELHTTRIPEFLLSVRSVVATFTRGFPDSKLPQVNVPDSLLLELAPIDYGPANGFLHTYRAFCSYFNTPVSPDIMQYVTDLVYANVLDFSIGDCPGIEPKCGLDFNTEAVAAALRHNTYFRSISAVGVRRKDSLYHFSNVLRYNTYISKVIFSDLQEGNVAELGDAMMSNPQHAVQLLDLSKTHLYKGVSNLAQALQHYQHSLKMLSLSGCNIESAKMLQLVQALSANYGMSITIERLDLSGNKFDEPASMAFESWLSKVAEYSTLRELRLANTGINMVSAATYFHFLVCIEVLDLSRNKLEPRAVQLTCSLLEKSSTLRDLNVSSCSLTAVQAAALLSATGQNKRLSNTILNMSNNEFSDSEFEALASAITACTNTHTLDLSGNVFKERSLIGVLQSVVLSACPTLDTLALDKAYKSTYPGERVASALFSVINSLRSVKSVRIAGGFGSVVVPLLKMLRTNTNLLELDISDNRLGDKGASAIADLLRHNRTIASIKCDGNNISPTGWKMILSSFIANTTLAYIDFAWNDYSKWASNLSADRLLELQAVLLDIQRTVQTNCNAEGHSRHRESARSTGVPLPLTVAPLADLPHQLSGGMRRPHFRRLSDGEPTVPTRPMPVAPGSSISGSHSSSSLAAAAGFSPATAAVVVAGGSASGPASLASSRDLNGVAITNGVAATNGVSAAHGLRRSLPSDMSGAKLSNLPRAEAGQPFRLVWNYAENSYIDYTSFDSGGESDYTNVSDDDDDDDDDDVEVDGLSPREEPITLANLHSKKVQVQPARGSRSNPGSLIHGLTAGPIPATPLPMTTSSSSSSSVPSSSVPPIALSSGVNAAAAAAAMAALPTHTFSPRAARTPAQASATTSPPSSARESAYQLEPSPMPSPASATLNHIASNNSSSSGNHHHHHHHSNNHNASAEAGDDDDGEEGEGTHVYSSDEDFDI